MLILVSEHMASSTPVTSSNQTETTSALQNKIFTTSLSFVLLNSIEIISFCGSPVYSQLFISGEKKCPQSLISDGAETKANPAFEEWTAIDQLLLGWIYNTLIPEIASHVIGYKTSYRLRKAVKDLVGAHTRSRITLLKGELHRTRKYGLKMSDYLAKMKNISDNLLLAGCMVSSKDLITQTLAGLDSDYNPIVVQLSDKHDLSWVDLQSALLTYEIRLEQLTNITNVFNANIVSHTSANPNWKNQNNNNNQRGGRTNRGRGRGRNNNSRHVCQVCGKTGHTAAVCYFRYDNTYMGFVPGSTNSSYVNNSITGSHPAYFATANSVVDQSLYMDSGASNHITNDLSTVEQVTNNHGKKHIEVGNGDKLKIFKSGSVVLPCKKKNLNLKNVLHTP